MTGAGLFVWLSLVTRRGSLNYGVRKMSRKTDAANVYGISYAAFSGMGISHGLKTVHRTVFFTAFRFPHDT